jgi:hypothetical protein
LAPPLLPNNYLSPLPPAEFLITSSLRSYLYS